MRLCVVRSALLQKLEVMRRLNICTAFFFVPRSQEINENDTFSLQSCKFRWSRWPTRMRNCQSSRHKNHFDPSVQLHSLRIRTSSCRPVSQKNCFLLQKTYSYVKPAHSSCKNLVPHFTHHKTNQHSSPD